MNKRNYNTGKQLSKKESRTTAIPHLKLYKEPISQQLLSMSRGNSLIILQKIHKIKVDELENDQAI